MLLRGRVFPHRRSVIRTSVQEDNRVTVYYALRQLMITNVGIMTRDAGTLIRDVCNLPRRRRAVAGITAFGGAE